MPLPPEPPLEISPDIQHLLEQANRALGRLDNAEPRTAENTTPTSFRQWCEEVLKPAVLN